MMRLYWIGLVGGLLFGVGGGPALGQSTADAFFHTAAQRYVDGNAEAALRAVERGLERAPSDPRLRALRRKLEQQREQSGGGRSSQQGQQGQRQRDPSEGAEGPRERPDESGREAQSQSDAANRASSRRRASGTPEAGSAGETTPGGTGADRADQRRAARSLSRAQAARLLRALENQEQKLLREVQGQSEEPQPVAKDW